jgi:hypothetical protein
MRAWIFSDLHFDANRAYPFRLPDPRPTHVVVIIAGDLREGLATSVRCTPAEKILTEIAYSALDSFGTTAIRSLFADADTLGRLVTNGQLTGALTGDAVETALSEIIVQHAGDLASAAQANDNRPCEARAP